MAGFGNAKMRRLGGSGAGRNAADAGDFSAVLHDSLASAAIMDCILMEIQPLIAGRHAR